MISIQPGLLPPQTGAAAERPACPAPANSAGVRARPKTGEGRAAALRLAEEMISVTGFKSLVKAGG